MQGAIICSQATLVVCFEKKETENGGTGACVCVCVRRRENERNKWTHLLPKALLLQLIYQKGEVGRVEEFFLIG